MEKSLERIYTLDQVDEVAQLLAVLLDTHAMVTLTGPLGAGKTTLVKELLRTCGVQDVVTSPTYTYLNVHEDQRGRTFHHFDLYRIKTLDEFHAAGFDEYLYAPDSRALIEWPEIILPLLTHSVCHVTVDYTADRNARQLKVQCVE